MISNPHIKSPYQIPISSRRSPSVSPVRRGFGPRRWGDRRRPSRVSKVPIQVLAPTGRPVGPDFRTAVHRAWSSASTAAKPATSAIRVRAGSTDTCGELRPAMWAPTLDHGQSAAGATRPACTGLGDVAENRQQVVLIHRHRAEPAVEQMPRPGVAGADEARGTPVGFADRQGQTGLVWGANDQVNVVGRQTTGPAGNVAAAKLLGHQVEVDRLVTRLQEDPYRGGFHAVSHAAADNRGRAADGDRFHGSDHHIPLIDVRRVTGRHKAWPVAQDRRPGTPSRTPGPRSR